MLRPRLFAVLALTSCPLGAQSQLRPFAEIPAPGIANSVTAGPTRCDPHGDIYMRIASEPDVSRQLLARIGRDGSMTTFNPEKVTDIELRGWFFQDFAISRDTVCLLATISSKADPAQHYVLRFNQAGDYKGSLRLDADFDAEQLALFDSGELLVSGTEQTGWGKDARFQTITAMFDKQGKFLKRIELEEERVRSDKPEPSEASDYTKVSAGVTLGAAESDGGEIYVLRAAVPPLIFVISAAGTAARRFVLELPSGYSRVSKMRVSQGQIAIEFVKPKGGEKPAPGAPVAYDMLEAEYVVYDAFSGNKLASYVRAPEVPGSFVCFDGQGTLEFLGVTESGTRKIVRASAN
jgi:hypothetical protein